MNGKEHCLLLILGLLTMAALPFLLWGCTGRPPCPVLKKNGISYGWQGGNFMGEWDDYYACALSYIDGGYYPEALACLDLAINQRPADQRMARTYGMHFIHDYFPNREKGVIHFWEGDYQIAETKLLMSLEQEPSAKACYYLDEVRKKLMEEKKTAITRPRISITLPPGFEGQDGYWRTGDVPLVIAGTVIDSQYVSRIKIKDTFVFMEGSQAQITFRETVHLGPGVHTVRISARNLMGGESLKQMNILVDKSGPLITITRIRPGKDIYGYLHDESGMAAFTINERDIPVSENDGGFYAELLPGEWRIALRAKDNLGNETRSELNCASRKASLLAMNIGVTASDRRILPLKTADKPEIRMSGPAAKELFAKNTTLEFTVASKRNIVALDINGQSLLKKPGLSITCNVFVPLELGANRFTISALTDAGTAQEKTVVFERKIPEHLKLSYRYGIRMYDFDNREKTGNWHDFLQTFEEDFAANRRFRLFSKDANRVMAEPPGASCRSVLLGIVYTTNHGTEVVARLIDKKTSKIISVQDAFSYTFDMKYIGNRLSEKIHREFPLATGIITSTGGLWAPGGFKFSLEAAGSQRHPETRIKPDWPVLVYREGQGGFTEVIAVDCIEGKCGKISAVKKKPGIGDKVITQ